MSPPTAVLFPTMGRLDERADGAAEQPLALPTVTAEYAEAASLIHLRRRPWRTRLLGRATTVAAAPCPADEDGGDANRYLVRMEVDGRICTLSLPALVVRLALVQADPSLRTSYLSSANAALALELVLSDAIDALEAAWNCRLRLLSVAPAGDKAMRGEHPPLNFTLDIEGVGTSTCALLAAPVEIARIARQLDRAAGIEKAAVDDTPLPVCLRIAASNPTIADLQGAACGDVILIDDICMDGVQAVAVIAEHLVAPVIFDATGPHISVRPVRGRGSIWEWSMDKHADASGEGKIADADLDDIPVHVVFEIGRIELPLGEVRRLDAGALIPVARSPDNAVDIMVHGRRIGRGSLVTIGDSLGVRITRIFDHV